MLGVKVSEVPRLLLGVEEMELEAGSECQD